MLITPNWDARSHIHAAMSTRAGGVSTGAYASMNLGYSTDDDRDNVYQNERRIAAELKINTDDIRWLHQIHSNEVRHAETLPVNHPLGATEIKGDAIVSHTPGLVCGIKVADCMPVLITSVDGDVVAAAHAGWRGLCGGVLENTVTACNVSPARLIAWCGPCIGPFKFEVGEEVRDAFIAHDGGAKVAFNATERDGKFLCDLSTLAMQRLRNAGVSSVSFSRRCTVSEPDVFFSHRRDRISGRMAAFVWIDRQ